MLFLRNTILTLIFLTLATTPTKAQEVYNLVLSNAIRVVNSPTSGFAQTQIAQFKRTTLVYIKSKAFEQTDSIPASFLDTQAYYLSEFITLFFDEILKSKKMSDEKKRDRIYLFMDASVSNPLFNDPDEETTMAYIKDSGEITPFSINTDWEKAYAAVKDAIKSKK